MDRLDCRSPGPAPDFAPIDLAGASGEPDARPEPTRIWDSMRIWDPQIRDIHGYPLYPIDLGVSMGYTPQLWPFNQEDDETKSDVGEPIFRQSHIHAMVVPWSS
jgi:hypothetical protein